VISFQRTIRCRSLVKGGETKKGSVPLLIEFNDERAEGTELENSNGNDAVQRKKEEKKRLIR